MKKNSSTADTCINIDSMPSINDMDISTHNVPLVIADKSSFQSFGHLVKDYENEKVIIETWPAPDWRPIEEGTGNEGGIAEGLFLFERRGALMLAKNEAVDGYYITGWFSDPAVATELEKNVDYSRIIVREANYHADGGQVFFPLDKTPFIALLAPAGDDVTPNDFIAFYCDGSFGIQIKSGIWHQPIFPLACDSTFKGKQGRVHACIACDFVEEFNCYLSVPLTLSVN